VEALLILVVVAEVVQELQVQEAQDLQQEETVEMV
jgi:hypothetical protein